MTVACVWVRGNVPYGVEYVERLAAMVRRHLPRPHRFVCLTDRPQKLPAGIESIRIAPIADAGWWSKIELFNPCHQLSGRVLYLDLDTLIVDGLLPIVDFPAPFVTLADGGSAFQPRSARVVIKRFNSSVMAFTAGTFADLFTEWQPAVAWRLHGDQDWLAEQHPEAATLPADWCPRLSSFSATGEIPSGARVILAKVPKNHDAAKRWPWFREIWTGAR